ncbi:MAG TPA: hypothetical protein VG944_16725 [Fimbriimonas sp.]|nr:hypothetical protein [Fimbriimonas sp.]
MSTEAHANDSLHGARALLSRLKDHPEERNREPEELAEEFGLTVSFVNCVLERSVHTHPQGPSPVVTTSRAVVKSLGNLLDQAAANPTAYVVISTAIAEILTAVVVWINGAQVVGAKGTINSNGLDGIFLGVAALSQMGIYMRRATVRYPLYGALTLWVLCSLPLMFLAWLNAEGRSEWERGVISMGVAAVLFLVCAAYAALGALFSLTGVYLKSVQEERREDRMTRQELLERLFELQARLDTCTVAEQTEVNWDSTPTANAIRKNLYPLAFLVGLGLQFLLNLVFTWQHFDPFTLRAGHFPTVAQTIYIIGLQIIVLSAVAGGGLLSSTAASALVTGGLFFVGRCAGDLLPVGDHGLQYWQAHPEVWSNLALRLAVMEVLATVFRAAATVQRRVIRDMHLQRNDQATLIAEMLKIQWRLSGQASRTCVMVVDVVKSSQMKVEADPLDVEYSFREYQQWIEELSEPLGGKVHSTAGDGAVIAFPKCEAAFTAAKRIQGGIDEFNRTHNRIPTPFRVRIGLHVGQVQGELQKVQFTHVIDVAAHVQEMSPVSGIAATGDVVADLNEDDFVPLARQVDDHSVYLALDPVGS